MKKDLKLAKFDEEKTPKRSHAFYCIKQLYYLACIGIPIQALALVAYLSGYKRQHICPDV